MLHRGAGWLADRRQLPGSVRAVAGYYADAGVFDYRSILLKRRVDDVVDGMVDRMFADISRAIADEFGYDDVTFGYDTKLVLPAKLTLGHLYRQLDESNHLRAEEMTRLAVEALVDGDMQDALNDREFDDFEVDVAVSERERWEIARIAQERIQRRVKRQLAEFPDAVQDTYEWAVDVSNAHQDRDEWFRELMAAAQRGEDVTEQLESEYKHAEFEELPKLFTDAEQSLPYLKTQYDRVGILYDAMIDMYRESGLPVGRSFQRSIVLAIIGAQIWLDDIDDFEQDIRAGQLTPVTAEYLLASDGQDPRGAVNDIGRRYLDRAQQEAAAADSALTGIAIEYIIRSGNPESLPPAIEIRSDSASATGDDPSTGRPGGPSGGTNSISSAETEG